MHNVCVNADIIYWGTGWISRDLILIELLHFSQLRSVQHLRKFISEGTVIIVLDDLHFPVLL
jgi:hypothetical protein